MRNNFRGKKEEDKDVSGRGCGGGSGLLRRGGKGSAKHIFPCLKEKIYPFSTHENICLLMLYTIVHTFLSWSILYTSYLGFFSH